MTGSAAAGGLLVQQGQLSTFRIHAEGAHRAFILAADAARFPDRVEETPVRMRGQKTRTLRLSRQLGSVEFARDRIELRNVYALALRARVGPEIDAHWAVRVLFRCRGGGCSQQAA